MTATQQAHRESIRLDLSLIAGKLQDVLGQRLTAYAVGVRDPRTIGKYAREDIQSPSDTVDRRLRQLYVIVQILLTRETASTVRAWMVGSHPLLDDRAPVELLHEEDVDPVERTADVDASPPAYVKVRNAAEDFVVA